MQHLFVPGYFWITNLFNAPRILHDNFSLKSCLVQHFRFLSGKKDCTTRAPTTTKPKFRQKLFWIQK